MLDEKNPPEIFILSLDDLVSNEDGLYKKEDIVKRFEDAIANYNVLK